MAEILHLGLSERYLQGIRDHSKDSVFINVSADNIDGFFSQGKQDVLLIGDEVGNPIKIAQKAYSSDKCLSILIISEPSHYQEVQQALMLTPFIGNSVKCVPDGNDLFLAETIEELALRTKQRRNYEVLKNAELSIQAMPNHEQLKEEYLNNFFDNAPLGAILLNEKGMVLAMNKFSLSFFNSPELEILGKRFDQIFPDNIKKQVYNFVNDGYRKRLSKTFALSEKCYVDIRVSEVNFQNTFLYKTVILNDVTEVTQSELKLKEFVKELKKTNNDLDSFIYTASHDLKAPISNIEGLIYSFKDILREKDPNLGEISLLLSLIEKSVLKFKETIGYLTEIAKVQKNITEDPEDIKIDELLKDVLLSIGNMVKESNAVINIDADDCQVIKFSRVNLHSIFYNLITNSIKYRSPDRPPVIDVTCKSKRNRVQICVSDNGLGLSKDKVSKMFSMFRRFHDHVEGSGVGLYLVKRILNNSGGNIRVDSELGKGTTFTILLPV
ncbi:HAMP domain-containing sensor histidine kinase [Cytophagaceae bacterium ABcell3]|nr:HAMP domain-containing sensor histidine kinase [Cytophagaceae bacterium ABcell3]